MNNRDFLELLRQQEMSVAETAVGSKKLKKFLRIAIPILILEIIAVIGLVSYLIILPKNYCNISTNMDKAVIYVNDKKTNKFRFTPPKEKASHYYYGVQISILLPDNSTYLVSYTFNCEKYSVSASTTATSKNGEYSLYVEGGVKTQLLSGITFMTDKLNNFDVDLKIKISKLT